MRTIRTGSNLNQSRVEVEEMQKNKLLQSLGTILKKAGKAALKKQAALSSFAKNDGTPVTDVDLYLSDMLQTEIKKYASGKEHMVVDEEKDTDAATQWKKFETAKYAWFVDPLAGTWAYMNGLPLFAISIGILANKRPYLGAVYLPALDELYWTNSKKSFLTKGGMTKVLTKQDKTKADFSLFYINNHQKFSLGEKTGRSLSFPAVNPAMLWAAKGSLSGALFQMKLWDVAGAWTICKPLGLNLYNGETGALIDDVSAKDFDENWKMKHPIILSNNQNITTFIKNVHPLKPK
jgi:fructose-1,6-bisphosphatase/inositol monophosphatase family enzyme